MGHRTLELKRAAVAGVFVVGATFSLLGQHPVGAAGLTAMAPVTAGLAQEVSQVKDGLGERVELILTDAQIKLERVAMIASYPIVLFQHPAPLVPIR